jgi:hypothetical protein
LDNLSNYFSEGYKIFQTELVSSLFQLKQQFISVFNEVSLAEGLGSITNDSEFGRILHKKTKSVVNVHFRD